MTEDDRRRRPAARPPRPAATPRPARPTAARPTVARPTVTPRPTRPTQRESAPRTSAPRPSAQRQPVRRKPAVRARAPRRTRRRLAGTQLRLRAALLAVLTLLLILGGRLVQLQGLDSAAYAARGAAQRTRMTVLPATRGAITDRWGHPLALDLDLRVVFVDPTLEKAPDEMAAKLAPLLSKDAATIAAAMRTPKTRYVVLAHYVQPSVAQQVLALGDPALGADHESQRSYPDKDLAAALIGVTQGDATGLSGVEALLNGTLAGNPGKVEQEYAGNVPIPDSVHEDVPAVDGSSVRLTIDRDLQYSAQQALAAQIAASKATGGQVIVLDPSSGDVLALASAPTFDLSTWTTGKTPNLSVPALQTPYEPGSVNKVITAAAAIEDGVATPTTPLVIPNSFAYPGRPSPVIDAENHGTEDLTLTGVLAESSNIGIDKTALLVGNDKLYAMLRAFGLGSPSGLAWPGESSGVIPSLPWNPSVASTIPFGQGMSATALQIADAYATIANGGVRVPAHLIRSTVSPSGVVHPFPAPLATRVVSASTASTVSKMLEAVTTEGTAPAAQILGYRVAGKTGTAEAVGSNGQYDSSHYVDSFVGFAPADAPRLVVEVVIDHPTQGSHFGGTVAAPVFQKVMSYALREYSIPPTGRKASVPALCWGDAVCPVASQ